MRLVSFIGELGSVEYSTLSFTVPWLDIHSPQSAGQDFALFLFFFFGLFYCFLLLSLCYLRAMVPTPPLFRIAEIRNG